MPRRTIFGPSSPLGPAHIMSFDHASPTWLYGPMWRAYATRKGWRRLTATSTAGNAAFCIFDSASILPPFLRKTDGATPNNASKARVKDSGGLVAGIEGQREY